MCLGCVASVPVIFPRSMVPGEHLFYNSLGRRTPGVSRQFGPSFLPNGLKRSVGVHRLVRHMGPVTELSAQHPSESAQ